ncbi:MAG: hypothetical protein GY906_12660 [bacterium]|nr:hypothetical protein [bacterium]
MGLSSFVLRGLCVLILLVGCSFVAPDAWATPPEAPPPEFVAYYFHGNLRCKTCRTLEAYSEEAFNEGFKGQLATGQLKWQVVNVETPEHKHFVKDFELASKAVVLVEYRRREVVRSKNLRLVWQLVGDKDGFLQYVRDSTREFMTAD